MIILLATLVGIGVGALIVAAFWPKLDVAPTHGTYVSEGFHIEGNHFEGNHLTKTTATPMSID